MTTALSALRWGTLEVVQPPAPSLSAPTAAPSAPTPIAPVAVAPASGAGDGYAVSLDDPSAVASDKLRAQLDAPPPPEGTIAKKEARPGGKAGARATKPMAGAGAAQASPDAQTGFLEVDKAQRGADIALKKDAADAEGEAAPADERLATGATAGAAPSSTSPPRSTTTARRCSCTPRPPRPASTR